MSLTEPRQKRQTHPLLLAVAVIVPAAAIAYGMYWVQVLRPSEANSTLNQTTVVDAIGLTNSPVVNKLSDRYVDADQDLVADAPTDPAKLIDPPKIMVSYIVTEDKAYAEVFKDFVDYLSKMTGKPVEYATFESTTDELTAMRDGTLHVAGFSTGNVPTAVDEAGFVPAYMLATADGSKLYKMRVIVPAASPLQKLTDVADHEITLTEPGSNSGYKAPLLALRDAGLLPVRDFQVRYSGGHKESAEGIADGTYQIAAVADDVLARLVNEGTIQAGQVRAIYTSEQFPTASFGYAYNLKPELVTKIKEAFKSFDWKGTGLEAEFGKGGQTQFMPADFKTDWSLVRRIDESMGITHKLEDRPKIDETTRPTGLPGKSATTREG